MFQVKQKTPVILTLIAACSLLAACTGDGAAGVPGAPPPASTSANIVFSVVTGGFTGSIQLIKEDGTGLVTLTNSTIAGAYAFNGVAPNGRVVYTAFVNGVCGTNCDPVLYSVNADGTGTVLLATSARYSGITPGGQVIYSTFVGPAEVGQSDLYSVNADGTGTAPLANSGNGESFRGITPGGRVIYSMNVGGQSDLYSVNADGTGTVVLANSTDVEDPGFFADFSGGITPDGRVIYARYVGNSHLDIYSVNADGTGTVVLANTTGHEYFRGITPDGRVIYEWEDGGTFDGGQDLYIVNADGTGTTILANSTDIERFAGITSGGRVIYQRFTGAGLSGADLYSVNTDGTGTATLANSADTEGFVGITPGGRVIYSRVVSASLYDLYSVNADGSGTVVLSMGHLIPPGGSDPIAITADGRVVFSKLVAGTQQSDLYSINADGTGLVVLANSPDIEVIITRLNSDGRPVNSVTPGGRVIYERRPVSNFQTDIYIVNADGMGTTVLANSADMEVYEGFF